MYCFDFVMKHSVVVCFVVDYEIAIKESKSRELRVLHKDSSGWPNGPQLTITPKNILVDTLTSIKNIEWRDMLLY